ncbi:MAG: hypothetical protein Q8R00_01920 [Candidatus Nanoarchaeia archaeon]|nr:hypothetical protein [Candidatus Nanoarchaeia archaeon]
MIPKQDLPEFYNIVIDSDKHEYLQAYSVLENFTAQPGIIISLRRPAKNIRDQIQRLGFEIHEETHFIDGISKHIDNDLSLSNTIYLNSPKDLKSIADAIKKLADRMPLSEKFLIFDSPQIALNGADAKTSLHFLNHITNQLRDYNFRGIFMTHDVKASMKSKLGHFADAFIKL